LVLEKVWDITPEIHHDTHLISLSLDLFFQGIYLLIILFYLLLLLFMSKLIDPLLQPSEQDLLKVHLLILPLPLHVFLDLAEEALHLVHQTFLFLVILRVGELQQVILPDDLLLLLHSAVHVSPCLHALLVHLFPEVLIFHAVLQHVFLVLAELLSFVLKFGKYRLLAFGGLTYFFNGHLLLILPGFKFYL
jgi:hypothetical protein